MGRNPIQYSKVETISEKISPKNSIDHAEACNSVKDVLTER